MSRLSRGVRGVPASKARWRSWHLDDQAICEKAAKNCTNQRAKSTNVRRGVHPRPTSCARSGHTSESCETGETPCDGVGGRSAEIDRAAARAAAPGAAPRRRAARRASDPRGRRPAPLGAARARRRTRAAGRRLRRCARSASRPSWASRGPTSVRSRTPCPTRRRATRRRTTTTTPTRIPTTRVRSSTLTSATSGTGMKGNLRKNIAP